MTTRRVFLNSVLMTSGILPFQEAFANTKNDGALLDPVLSKREIKNSYWYMGHLISVLLTSRQTEGLYALLRATERRGLVPPPHTHTKEDETFLILEGEVIYSVGDETLIAKVGDVVFLPRNIQHSFKIQTEKLETMILLTPGGFEDYFIEMSKPADDLMLPPFPSFPPDIGKLVTTAAKYGIIFPNR